MKVNKETWGEKLRGWLDSQKIENWTPEEILSESKKLFVSFILTNIVILLLPLSYFGVIPSLIVVKDVVMMYLYIFMLPVLNIMLYITNLNSISELKKRLQ